MIFYTDVIILMNSNSFEKSLKVQSTSNNIKRT